MVIIPSRCELNSKVIDKFCKFNNNKVIKNQSQAFLFFRSRMDLAEAGLLTVHYCLTHIPVSAWVNSLCSYPRVIMKAGKLNECSSPILTL